MSNSSEDRKEFVYKASQKRKLYVFVFCLLLATFFWLLNALGNQFTTSVEFKINFLNPPKNKVILNELPQKFTLKVRGLGFDLMAYKLSFKDPVVDVDLSKFEELSNALTKEYTLPSIAYMPYISTQLGDDIEVKSVTPRTIYFKFDQRVQKTLKIVPVTDLSFKKQYRQFGKSIVKPVITEVSGPKSIVDTMQAVYTELVVLNNLWETVTHPVQFKYSYVDAKLTFSPAKAMLHLPVEKYTESTVKVKLIQKNVPDSITIKAIPEEVEIRFLLPLSKMASLPSAHFEAYIDYNLISHEYTNKLEVKMGAIPEFVTISKIEPKKVEYILKTIQ